MEDDNVHSPGSSALNQPESGTDSTALNENALPMNEHVNPGLGDETVNTSNAWHFLGRQQYNSEPVHSTKPTPAPTLQRLNENAPPINQQVSESYTTQSTTELL